MSKRIKTLFVLHLLLVVYSGASVCSKFASGTEFLSLPFLGFYVGVLALLGVYALGWQQVLKRLPLTTAYANRAVVIIWGIIWGVVFFAEPVTWPKVVGALFIMAGVVLFAHADAESSGASVEQEATSQTGDSHE